MDQDQARALLEAEARRLDDAAAAHHEVTAVGDDLVDREVELAIEARLSGDQRAVADALDRLDAGTYGACETCGAAIGDDRLEAVPATRFCRDHELAAETLLEANAVDGVDDGEAAIDVVRREAQQHLSFVAEDDGPDDDDQLAAEESAVHARPGP